MANLRVSFITALEADATLLALIPGGVTDAADQDFSGQGASELPRDPADPSGTKVWPHAIVRWRNSAPYDAYRLAANTRSVEVYVYQDTGYDIIEAVIKRLELTWHDRYLTADGQAIAHFSKAGNTSEIPAAEVGGTASGFVRFQVIHMDM